MSRKACCFPGVLTPCIVMNNDSTGDIKRRNRLVGQEVVIRNPSKAAYRISDANLGGIGFRKPYDRSLLTCPSYTHSVQK